MYLKKMTNKMKTVVALVAFISPMTSFASDHDDGISPLKPRNRNITDVYAFREDNQTGMAKDSDNLIVIMNSDPRAPSGKQEYFNSNAQYRSEEHTSELQSR